MNFETVNTTTDEKSEAKRIFKRNLNKAFWLKEDWARDTSQVICRYLNEVHKVRVSPGFAEQIVNAHCQFHSSDRNLSLPLKLVDAIYFACDMWREYLDSSEGIFDQLVCQEILSMVRIQTSVIAGRNFAEKKGLPLKMQPPFLFTTIVTETGTLKVYS